MINHGSVAMPYEPYTGGKPSPSPEYPQEIKNVGKWNEEKRKYEVDVRVTGKNLFDVEKAKNISMWETSINGYSQFKIQVKKGAKITVSYTEILATGMGFHLGVKTLATNSVEKWLYSHSNNSRINNSCTVIAQEDFLYLMCDSAGIAKFLDSINTLQIEISDTPTPYEPYKEQTITLTSDRPITKWDKLVEQDGQIGWLYQSAIKTFKDDVFKLYSDIERAIQYQIPFEEITDSLAESVCYCNTFENVIGQSIYTQSSKTDFYMGCLYKSMVFSAKNKEGIFQSVETFQEWIRNSSTYVWHKTDNKKFVPLPKEEQDAIRALSTYYPTTVITADGGEVNPDVEVTYIADTKNYIDQKIAAIGKTVVETQKALL